MFKNSYSETECLAIVLAVSADATSALIDGRLKTAERSHRLAARLWADIGSPSNAALHMARARAASAERIEAEAEEAL